jgi:tetratricopeptide (TPR) repeat protein
MKSNCFFILVFLYCSITGYSQSSASKRAFKAYNNMFYAEAADLYQGVVDRTGGTADDLIKLADCYSKLHEYIDAELTLEKLFKMSTAQPQPIILKYAQVLAQNERYDESMKYYKKYTLDSRGKNFYEAYWSLNKFYRDSSNVAVKFLPINSLQSEFSPVIYQKGLVFSSNRKLGTVVKRVNGRNQTPYTDLYYLRDTNVFKRKKVSDNVLAAIKTNTGNKKFDPDYTPETSNDSRTVGNYDPYYIADTDEENFLPVDPFDQAINSKYHEGPVSFTKNYDTIFFTRNSYNNGKRTRDDNKVTRLKIFFAIRNSKGQYEHVQEFPFNNPDYSVGHPAVTPDSKRLYFVTDKQGGFGETDIYYCDIREHRFTDPVNAGPVINTAGSEMFPSFNKDGSLYFSSNGHAGLGGLDIFRAEETNNQFQTPRNLRFPINSSKDDFGICSSDLHGSTGYLSSNRLRGRADDNIYSYIDNRPPRILVKGTIKSKHYDEDGKFYIEPLQDATVTIMPLGDKVQTDRTGTFEFLVNRGN